MEACGGLYLSIDVDGARKWRWVITMYTLSEKVWKRSNVCAREITNNIGWMEHVKRATYDAHARTSSNNENPFKGIDCLMRLRNRNGDGGGKMKEP